MAYRPDNERIKARLIDLTVERVTRDNKELLRLIRNEFPEANDGLLQGIQMSGGYIKALTDRHIANCTREEWKIWEKLVDKAGSVDISAMKLYFELTGRLKALAENDDRSKKADYSSMSDEQLDVVLKERAKIS